MVWQTLVSRAIEVLPGEGREVTLRRGTVHRLRSELLRHVEISHLGVIASSWAGVFLPQVITATDGLAWVTLGVGVIFVVVVSHDVFEGV